MLSFKHGGLEALNSQLDACNMLRKAINVFTIARAEGDLRFSELLPGFRADLELIKVAKPFAWTSDTVRATLSASHSIPMDTAFNRTNLPFGSVWWHFENPLPFVTTKEDKPIKALLVGHMQSVPSLREHLANPDDDRYFISSWTNSQGAFGNIWPSQTFTWKSHETVEDMLRTAALEHNALYGPGGKWHERALADDIIGIVPFLEACHSLAKFVLAGMNWINSKVVVAQPVGVPNKRRKEAQSKLGRVSDVHIIQLRRSERPEQEPTEGDEESKKNWTCQWTVDGHWRNQRVGPGRAETRLTWIDPYIKGPENLPLKVQKKKIYVVSR